ncbi:MAG: hypothetical protein AABW64_03940 [Nanoarchaeota archaeon]|mgnify:CR=1 FL=1
MKKRLVLFLIVLYGFIPSILAIGISPAQQSVDFQPHTKLNLTTVVLNGGLSEANVSLAFSGELNAYIRFAPEHVVIPPGSMHTFSFLLDFPAQIKKPGRHLIQIYAIEAPLGKKSGIVPLTAVNSFLYVTVPYTGKYAEFDVETRDVNIGEPVIFKISTRNLALDNISSASTTVFITNRRDESIETLATKPIFLPAQTTTEETLVLQTTTLEPGPYRAIAILDYDGEKSLEKEIPFRIGTLFVALLNYTNLFTAEEINKFVLDVENRWNLNIEQMYGEISILKEGQLMGSVLRTPSLSLEPWERKTLTTFFDTRGLEPGKYTAQITLFYSNMTTQETGSIRIMKQFTFNWTYLLIGVICLILFIDFLLWMRHRRKAYADE